MKIWQILNTSKRCISVGCPNNNGSYDGIQRYRCRAQTIPPASQREPQKNRHSRLELENPSIHGNAQDRYDELIKFEMEVTNILETKAYELTNEEKVQVIQNWLDQEDLQLIKTFTHEEKESLLTDSTGKHESKAPLMFITTYKSANPNFRELISKHWSYLGKSSATRELCNQLWSHTGSHPP